MDDATVLAIKIARWVFKMIVFHHLELNLTRLYHANIKIG